MHWEVRGALHVRFLYLLALRLLENVLIGCWSDLSQSGFGVSLDEVSYLSYVAFWDTFPGAILLCRLHWVIILIERNTLGNLRAIINIKKVIILPSLEILVPLVLFFTLLPSPDNVSNFLPRLFSHFPHIGFWHIPVSEQSDLPFFFSRFESQFRDRS